MEFVTSTSGQVTDITIPDGNVIKIEEAATGRVLWEKNLFPNDLSDISLEWFTIGLNEIGPDYSDKDRVVMCIAFPTNDSINSKYKNNPNVITLRVCVNSTSNASVPDTIYEVPCFYRNSPNSWTKILNPAEFIRLGTELANTTGIKKISNDGNMILFGSKNDNFYLNDGTKLSSYWLCSNIQYGDTLTIDDNNAKTYGLVNIYTDSDIHNIDSLYGNITYAPELHKYLVSSIHVFYDSSHSDYRVRSFSIPESLAKFETTQQDNKIILPDSAVQKTSVTGYGRYASHPCWSSKHQLFFAGSAGHTNSTASTSSSKYLLTSPDGITWARTQLFSDGGPVYGVINLSKRDTLCAIGENEVAFSKDGVTWEEKQIQFPSAPNYYTDYSYSPDYDLFCFQRNRKAFITRDFETWKESEPYSTSSLSSVDSAPIYCRDGIFAFKASHGIAFLTTKHHINGTVTL